MELLNIKYKNVILKFTLEKQDSNSKIMLIERCLDKGNKIILPMKIEVELTNNESCEIDIEGIENELCKGEIWDVYLYKINENKYERITMNNHKDFKSDYVKVNDKLKEIKPYVTGDNKLSIFVRKTIEAIECESIVQIQKDELEIKIKGISEGKNLIFKRRIQKEIEAYIDEVKIPYSNSMVNIKEIYRDKIINETYYDIFLEIYKGYEVPITYEGKLIQGSNLRGFSYLNKLMLKVQLDKKVYANDITLTEEEIIITLNEENKIEDEVIEVMLMNRDRKYTIMKGFKIEYIIGENKDTITLNKNEIYNLSNIKRSRYEISLLQKNEEGIYESLIGVKETAEGVKDGERIVSMEKVENNMLLAIRKIPKPINISILGSCLTRSAFSTNKYFNPTYKRKYNIAYTHFQSSLISVMNKKTVDLEINAFTASNDFMKACIETEFKKDFFEKLNDSNCDYLILDFFGDAMRGIIEFPNGAKVVGTIDYEVEDVLFNLPEGTKIIKSSNVKEYLPLWEASAKRFSEKIIKYVKEENIIINYTKITEKYLNEKREEKQFKGQEEYIKVSNAILDYTTNYISRLLPKASVIDTGQMNYIADKSHPLGLSPSHLVSQYYEELLLLIDESILNKIVNNH